MAFFIEQLRTVLPILGFDLFRPAGGPPMDDKGPIFELDAVGIRATARELDDGFIVLTGSTARRDGTAAFPEGYRTLRDQLVKDGKLVECPEPGHYRFAADVAFPSPSAAASVVMAGSASGPREWKLRGTGQTYKVWRAAKLAELEVAAARTAGP